jgi:MFS family permease
MATTLLDRGATSAASAEPGRIARTAVLAASGLTLMAQHYQGVPRADVLVRLVLTITSLAIAVGAPFAGYLADRFGRRPVLLGGLALFAAAGTAGLVVQSLGGLLATRAALGLAVGAVMTSVTALLTDWTTGARRAAYLGYQQAAASLGGVVLLPVAGLLAGFSWRAPFWLYATAVPVAVLVLMAVRDAVPDGAPEARPGSGSIAGTDTGADDARRGLRVAGLYGLAVVATAVFFMAPTQLPFLLGDLVAGPRVVGVAIAGSTLTGMVGALAFPALRRRLSSTAITLASLGALGAGWLIVGRADGVGLVLAGLLAGGFGVGLAVPNLTLRLGDLAPAGRRGRLLAGLVTGIFLGQFVSPIAAGPLVAATGLSGAFTWAGLVTAATAALAAPLLLRRRRN